MLEEGDRIPCLPAHERLPDPRGEILGRVVRLAVGSNRFVRLKVPYAPKYWVNLRSDYASVVVFSSCLFLEGIGAIEAKGRSPFEPGMNLSH